MEASPNRTFYFEVWSSFPLAYLYRWKDDNICQSIGDKSAVLWRTCWGTHWELGEHIENLTKTHCELEGNIVRTHWEPGKKGKHLECMLGPSHWLHEISLPKRVGHHFWLGLIPYLFTPLWHPQFKVSCANFRSQSPFFIPWLFHPKFGVQVILLLPLGLL
jgi:hypothetical protein